jgi:hypothetical protein
MTAIQAEQAESPIKLIDSFIHQTCTFGYQIGRGSVHKIELPQRRHLAGSSIRRY